MLKNENPNILQHTGASMRRISRLRRDQSGSILIIAAFGLLILVAMLSLAIDHGRNYLTESDMEAKLTAVSKSAGDEYIWWNIRRLVDQQAAAQHISPGVTDNTGNPDCAAHLLCGHLHDGAGSIVPTDLYPLPDGVKTVLMAFFQGQMLNNGINATVTFDASGPIVSTSSGTHYLLFRANSNDQKNFNFANHANQTDTVGSSGAAPSILAQSGVSVDISTGTNGSTGDTETNPTGFHVVFSLDWDSKTQLSDHTTDKTAQVFSLTRAVANLLANSGFLQNLSIGLTLGNVPAENGVGGLYDNTSIYGDGSAYAGTPDHGRWRKKNRLYSYLGKFIASDAVSCPNPVWTYTLDPPAGQCSAKLGPVLIYSSCPDEQGLVSHDCDPGVPAVGSATEAACACTQSPNECDRTGKGTCSNDGSACNVNIPNTCGSSTWSDDGSSCSPPGATRPTAPTWSDDNSDCTGMIGATRPSTTGTGTATCNDNGNATCSSPSCDCDQCQHKYYNPITKLPVYAEGHWTAACPLQPGTSPVTRSLEYLVAFSAHQLTDIDGSKNFSYPPVDLVGYIAQTGAAPTTDTNNQSIALNTYLNKIYHWTCSSPGAFNGAGGVPFGGLASADTPQANCQLALADTPQFREYYVEFARAGCATASEVSLPQHSTSPEQYGLSAGFDQNGKVSRTECDFPEGTYKVTMHISPTNPIPAHPFFFAPRPMMQGFTPTPVPWDPLHPGSTPHPENPPTPTMYGGTLAPPIDVDGDNAKWALRGPGNAYIDVTNTKMYTDPLFLGNGSNGSCGVTCPNTTNTGNLQPYIKQYTDANGNPILPAESHIAVPIVPPELFMMGNVKMELSRQLDTRGDPTTLLTTLPLVNFGVFDTSKVGTIYTGAWDPSVPMAVQGTTVIDIRDIHNNPNGPIGGDLPVDLGTGPGVDPGFKSQDANNVLSGAAIWTPALEVVRSGNSAGSIPQNITFAQGKFDDVLNVLQQGYTPYNITGGMADNQCALLKWGVKQLIDVVGNNQGVKHNILYIGGFPPKDPPGYVTDPPPEDSDIISRLYYDYNTNLRCVDPGYLCMQDVLWSASSNVWHPSPTSSSLPGEIDPATGLLQQLDNPDTTPGNQPEPDDYLETQTRQCFRNVKSNFLTNLFIITDGDIAENVTTANTISSTNTPGSGCDHPCLLGNQSGDTSTADCTAQLLHCLSSPSHEVRKR